VARVTLDGAGVVLAFVVAAAAAGSWAAMVTWQLRHLRREVDKLRDLIGRLASVLPV
jgi:hypothetical protein